MDSYLESIRKQFAYYRKLGEGAMNQLDDAQLFWQPDPVSNSISVIVNHLAGNMRSRFTDFLASDGEKPWRNRDQEFENVFHDRDELWVKWTEGWECLLQALTDLSEKDLETVVYIRNEGHTVVEALNRQLAHYAYHVGQIVYLARMQKGPRWQSLSIPKNGSQAYNDAKFSREKGRRHFTDDERWSEGGLPACRQ